jgi:hypothetical protein
MERLFERLNISKDAIDALNLITDTYNLFKFFKEHPIIYDAPEVGGKRLKDGRYYYIGRNDDNDCIYDKNEIFEICVENKRLNIKKKKNKFIKKYDTKFSGSISDLSKKKKRPRNSYLLRFQGEVFKQKNMTEKPKHPSFSFKKYGSKENAYKAAVKYMKKMNYKYKTIKNRVRWMGDHYEGEVWYGGEKNENGRKDMKRLYCKFDKEHLELFTKYIWSAKKDRNVYYVECGELGRKEGESQLFHQHVCKDKNWEKSIDHINGNGLDNRTSNLRDGSVINIINQTMHKNNTSGYNGVYGVNNKDDILIAYRSIYPGEEKRGGHRFSINKYGKDEALNLAVKDRKAYDARSGCKNGLRK